MTKDKTATITLDFPVQLADCLLTEVTMRRPTLGDLLDYPVKGGSDFVGEAKLLAVLSGLSPEDLRLLDLEDYDRLQKQFLFFRGLASEN